MMTRCNGDGKNIIPATAVQNTSPSTSVCTGNTQQGGSQGVAEGCGQQQETIEQPTKADAAVQYEVDD